MAKIVELLHQLFVASPEIAIFLCLALGYRVGKIRFGSFQLGGVTGSLLMAVVVSQVGVPTDPRLKNLLFALFIYAVGYESGPQFFKSLNRRSLKEILLAFCLAISALITVVALARIFGLDKGLAAGVAGGGLTVSAILGTASDTIAGLGLTPDKIEALQHNVAIGFAVTYVFGVFGTIVICVNVIPWFMKTTLRDDAIRGEIAQAGQAKILQTGDAAALPAIVGRVYRLAADSRMTVAELESSAGNRPVTVEKVKRGSRLLTAAPDLGLHAGDLVLLIGQLEDILALAPRLGKEVRQNDMEPVLQRRDVLVTADALHGGTFRELHAILSKEARHGVYVVGMYRGGKPLPVEENSIVNRGDVLTLFGSEQDVARAANSIGHPIVQDSKTDLVYLGIGMIVGLLIGLATVRIAGLPLTLGSGGGALISGLFFGWYRTRRPNIGYMPPGAVQILKDFGLAGFVVVVGLASGLEAMSTIKQSGISLFLIGALVTIIPLLITMVIGRYLLGYTNAAVLAGALSGARAANPAFGEVLNKAGNSVPTVPFVITYALSNVFLTLLGPLVVIFA